MRKDFGAQLNFSKIPDNLFLTITDTLIKKNIKKISYAAVLIKNNL